MQDLKPRTFQFAIAVGKLVGLLPNNLVNQIYLRQLVRCSSSIGANYRAARRAKSPADFLYKLKIVEEETDESIYFLDLLKEFNCEFKFQLDSLLNEAAQILKIIVASINTVRSKQQKNNLLH